MNSILYLMIGFDGLLQLPFLGRRVCGLLSLWPRPGAEGCSSVTM